MMSNSKKHYSAFKVSNYHLSIRFHDDQHSVDVTATLRGAQSGRPSSRITIRNSKAKVLKARLTRLSKKGDVAHPVTRLIHHRGFEEVRLHTEQPLYSGEYFVELEYIIKTPEDQYDGLKALSLALSGNQHIEHKDIAQLLPSNEPADIATSYTVDIEKL